MKSKLALMLALAAVLAVPVTYAKGPPSEPPGQAKKEEGQQPPGQEKKEEAQAQAPAADQASGGQATAQENNAASAGAPQSAQPASAAQPAKPAKPAAGRSAKPATRAKPATPAKPAHHATPARHATPAQPVTPAVHSTTAPKPAAAAEAGKVTICHATHSATNPYVEITISVNGLNGHDHHDDIVPAPDGGCPAPQPGLSIAGGPTASVSSSGGGAGIASVEAASVSAAGIPAAEAEAQGAPTSGVAGVQAFGAGKPLAAKKSGGVLGTVTRSKLPFTGLPLLPFVLGGLLAIVVGGALVRRRATRTL